MFPADPIPMCGDPGDIRARYQSGICLGQQNLEDLKRIQDIVFLEEDRVLSYDEVLAKILTFYAKFVPFK